jgi:flavin-dependent amine oxidoreductase
VSENNRRIRDEADVLQLRLEEFPRTGGGRVYRPRQMAAVVREGLERMSFAGEHTESLAGFMESAVRSGHRVAAQLGTASGSRVTGTFRA